MRGTLNGLFQSGCMTDIRTYYPDELRCTVPCVIPPGWCISLEDVDEFLKSISQSGRTVISYNQPFSPKREEVSHEQQNAVILLNIMDQLHLEQVDIVGYSESCIYSLMAIERDPSRFRNVVLTSPAGIVPRTLFEHNIRFFIEGLRSCYEVINDPEHFKIIKNINNKNISSWLQHPKVTLAAIRDITSTEICGLMRDAHQKGIQLAIVHGANDFAFPVDAIRKKLQPNFADRFYAVSGIGHYAIVTKQSILAMACQQALENLELMRLKKDDPIMESVF